MNQKNIIVGLVVVLIVVGLGFLTNKVNKNKGYSVVYMTTGEVYIGKLKTFPDFQLTDGYIYQITKDTTDPNKNNFQLQPINEALWATSTLHLNRKNVIFYGLLNPTSKIAETLAAQKKN